MVRCYFDGVVVEESKASISIHNVGVQRGFGIFDFFRVRNGKPSFIEDHLDRFYQSQNFLGLDRLIEKDEIRDAVNQLQKLNGFKEGAFKLMLLGSGSEDEAMLKPLFYITNLDTSSHSIPKEASVILHEYIREYPTVKSTNYLTSNYLHQAKNKANAIDVIYHYNGVVSEASRSNVFVVKDGVLLTPASNILLGVTRNNIISLASDMMPMSIEDVTLDQLKNADEVFLTSTLKEVLPITLIDGKQVGEGQIGTYTRKIQEAFTDLLH